MLDPSSPAIDRLLAIMARLRDPADGCPWDVEQTFQTIAPYTIEEAYEVADAIERNDMSDLKDELGDLLLQVVFHARMAEESGVFDFDDVVEAISDKMVRRHPHVFGDEAVDDASAQSHAWEEHKAAERFAKAKEDGKEDYHRLLDGLPHALPALLRATKLQKRAARVGFDWTDSQPVFDKVLEELDEVRHEVDCGENLDRLEDEIGDLLFACANLARHLKIDAESALRRANMKFERRFRVVEDGLRAEGRTLEDSTLEEMERLWNAAKAAERRRQE